MALHVLGRTSHLSLSCLRQGTVFLIQVPLSGSTSSTMTKGASSRVTMDRWSSCSSAAEYSSKRGHTWYLMVREPLSHLPTCMWERRRAGRSVWHTGWSKRHFQPQTDHSGGEEHELRKRSIFTLSHCLSLSRRMMTSLGNIWWPSSLNDRFRPSNVTFMRYLWTRMREFEVLRLSRIFTQTNLGA